MTIVAELPTALPEYISTWKPDEKTNFEGIDISKGPRFTVSEAAQVFFGRTAYWLRSQETDGYTDPLQGRKSGKQRSYSLTDIETIANDLYEFDRISEERYLLAMSLVRYVGRVNDLPVGEFGNLCPICDQVMHQDEPLERMPLERMDATQRNGDGPWVHKACNEKRREDAKVARLLLIS